MWVTKRPNTEPSCSICKKTGHPLCGTMPHAPNGPSGKATETKSQVDMVRRERNLRSVFKGEGNIQDLSTYLWFGLVPEDVKGSESAQKLPTRGEQKTCQHLVEQNIYPEINLVLQSCRRGLGIEDLKMALKKDTRKACDAAQKDKSAGTVSWRSMDKLAEGVHGEIVTDVANETGVFFHAQPE